jgi:hypothetical protein
MVTGKMPGLPRITFSEETRVFLGGKEVVARYLGRGRRQAHRSEGPRHDRQRDVRPRRPGHVPGVIAVGLITSSEA